MGDIFQDKRFSHVGSDARFKRIPKNQRKVTIDKRFQSVFTDKKFQLKYAVDIRGRPVHETQADSYKKYYDIASDSDSDETSGSEKNSDTEKHLSDSNSINNDNDVSNDLDNEDVKSEVSDLDSELKTKKLTDKEKEFNKKLTKALDEEHKTKIKDVVHGRLQDMSIDYARGIGTIASDSSSDDDSSDESDSIFVEHPWGELDRDAETTDEATRRLAICYLDWDRIYSKDIMVLLHSFLPADGIIESVSIYPSEYGMERMKEEELKGPKELIEIAETQDLEDDDNNEDDTEGKAYHMEKLREYQLNRLKYYYAVVVCNNSETANKLYTECNGMEYESCAAKLDMRFIPDDMTFDQEPREVCTSLPDVTKYKPRLFENSALRQGKVALTWDETDPRRIEFNKRIASGDNINDDDLNNYIACSSEEEEVSDKEEVHSDNSEESNISNEQTEPSDKLSKYKSLIAALKNDEEKRKNKDVEMEITWGAGVKIDKDDSEQRSNKNEKSISYKKSENFSSEDEYNSDPLISSEEEESHTSLKKEKLKKKHKKMIVNDVNSSDEEKQNAELDLLLIEDNPEEIQKQHFSLKGIQKQEKEGKAKKKKWRKELKKKINANKEEDNFKVDVTDNRFSALYTSHLFNIDPAHPQFKKTKAMDDFIAEKQKRRKLEESKEIMPYSSKEESKKKLNPELSSLVNSIKGKTALKRKIT